ncbi:MAG: hypothetical protein JXR50_07245 [Prolixibacteraceae bacterium]|nr:hypothetical protein [Prolixibacteraceae bacterium]MBN2649519.1 hypothetical protein [Prolixibacteraceae bacterium]
MEEQNNSSVVKTSDWVITLLLLAIPLVNIIMLFVWAFGSGTNPSKANFAKASLIWVLILIVIYAFIALVFGAAMFSAFS